MERIFILTILLPTILCGQDTISPENRKLFIGVNFSPDYAYRYLTKPDYISVDPWISAVGPNDSSHMPMLSYTEGINIFYQINERINIETGLQYSIKGYKTNPMLIIYDWTTFPHLTAIARNFVYYRYLDIPLRANFSFLKNKVQIIASVGVTINYLLRVDSKTIPQTPTANFQTQTRVSYYNYKKINMSPTVSVGLKYKINDRINLRVEPTFRYGVISPIMGPIMGSRVALYLYTLGLNSSFNIGL